LVNVFLVSFARFSSSELSRSEFKKTQVEERDEEGVSDDRSIDAEKRKQSMEHFLFFDEPDWSPSDDENDDSPALSKKKKPSDDSLNKFGNTSAV